MPRTKKCIYLIPITEMALPKGFRQHTLTDSRVSLLSVDELLKEAGVGTDGRVHCEQFAKAVTRSPAKR